MAKITSITKEQERSIPRFIQKWVDAAGIPIDRTLAKKRLNAIMPDRTVMFAESMKNFADLTALIIQIAKVKKAEFDSQLGSQLDSQPIKWSYYVSYYWYSWAGYYNFASEIGVRFDDEKMTEFREILLNCPLIAFIGNLVFVIEKPTILWDAEKRLGNDQKPAISWKDGTGLYYLDGVHLQEEMWKQVVSQTMSFEEILKIEDSDVRAVALKYNKNAIIASGAELLDEHPTAGELFLIKGKEINRIVEEPELYFLRMKCPSTGRVFVEACDPKAIKKTPYAVHAQAAAWGISPDIYGQLRREG